MKRSRELATRWGLDPDAVERLERLAERLSSDPHAPTTVQDPARVWNVHIGDSLMGLVVPALHDAQRIVDIGSGAGLPGLPLAVALLTAQVDLVEATGRKARWIEATAQAIGLANAHAVHARAEEWAGEAGREAYDCAVVRAVDSLPVLLEYAAPLLRAGGTAVAWKRNLTSDEQGRGAEAAEHFGMSAELLDAGHDERFGDSATQLVLYRRTGPLPPGYPRRPGRARKRPVA